MLSTLDHNYSITALQHYGFTVRLTLQTPEIQNLFPIKIEIVFKIKTLLSYSVAKLTRVPLGPSSSLIRIFRIITQSSRGKESVL
jgi:hypothetical protein